MDKPVNKMQDKENKSFSLFERLPKDNLFTIFSFLNNNDLGKLARTSSTFKKYMDDKNFWLIKTKRELTVEPKLENKENYQAFYKRCYKDLLYPLSKLSHPNEWLETGRYQGNTAIYAASELGCEIVI